MEDNGRWDETQGADVNEDGFGRLEWELIKILHTGKQRRNNR